MYPVLLGRGLNRRYCPLGWTRNSAFIVLCTCGAVFVG